MEHLKDNWLTEGLIDFEYKKYQLLGYLKRVKESFYRVELYPFLSDLVFHYRNLMTLRENKLMTGESFPKELATLVYKTYAFKMPTSLPHVADEI